jgi:hypothetical protein
VRDTATSTANFEALPVFADADIGQHALRSGVVEMREHLHAPPGFSLCIVE